jgi:hypothetical protein
MSHPVDDDPIMASAIGRCSNSWAHVETILSQIFCNFTGTDFAIAVTVFSFFKATRTQREVLRKLAKISPHITEELKKRLNLALKTYVALAEERNELLHNPIGRSVEHQVYIMLRKSVSEPTEIPYHPKPISPTEIDDLSRRINALTADLREIDQAIFRLRFGTPIFPPPAKDE